MANLAENRFYYLFHTLRWLVVSSSNLLCEPSVPSSKMDDPRVAQVLAEYLQPKQLAAIARCSSLCHDIYNSSARRARSVQLWRRARLTLRIPARQWLQRLLPLDHLPPGVSGIVGALGIPSFWVDQLLGTLKLDRLRLCEHLIDQCRANHTCVRNWLQEVLKHPGPLLEQDQQLLAQLLQDHGHFRCDMCKAMPSPCYRHLISMFTANRHIVYSLPPCLLQVMLHAQTVYRNHSTIC